MSLAKKASGSLRMLSILIILAGTFCGAPEETEFGAPFDREGALPLSDLLLDSDRWLDEEVVVEARIGEVCQTSGCWCFLVEGSSRLYVSMSTFSLPPGVSGARCQAAGRLVTRGGRLTLLARGLRLISE